MNELYYWQKARDELVHLSSEVPCGTVFRLMDILQKVEISIQGIGNALDMIQKEVESRMSL